MNKKDRPYNMYRQSFQYIRNSCAGVYILTTVLILLNSFVAPLRTYILQLTIQSTEDYIPGKPSGLSAGSSILHFICIYGSFAIFRSYHFHTFQKDDISGQSELSNKAIGKAGSYSVSIF